MHKSKKESFIATEIYVWGNDEQGQLGQGNKNSLRRITSPKCCSFNLKIISFSCGEEHSAFITDSGLLYTMGSNRDGKLGLSNKNIKNVVTPTIVESVMKTSLRKVFCGSNHSFALCDKGEVYAWGCSEYGNLGLGALDSKWSPFRIDPCFFNRNQIIDISAGAQHSLFLTDKGEVFACGGNENGQLGTGKKQHYREPVPVNIKFTKKIDQLAAGHYHSLFLTINGDVLACGTNSFGELGLGHKRSIDIPSAIKGLEKFYVRKIAAGHHSGALTENKELLIWGTGVFGEFLKPTLFGNSGVSFVDLAIGGFFGIALDSTGLAWSWGTNSHGELGVGDFEDRVEPTYIKSLQGSITKVFVGATSAVAFTDPSKRGRSISPSLPRDYGRRNETNTDEEVDDDSNMHSEKIIKWSTTSKGKPSEEVKGYYPVGRKQNMDSAYRANSANFSFSIEERRTGKSSDALDSDFSLKMKNDTHVKEKSKHEATLQKEKAEIVALQSKYSELEKRMQHLHDGKGGLNELSSTLHAEMEKNVSLRQKYEQQKDKNVLLENDLQEERQQSNFKNEKLKEKDTIINNLKTSIRDQELELKDKKAELDQNYFTILKLKDGMREKEFIESGEVNKLSTENEELKYENSRLIEALKKMEEQKAKDRRELDSAMEERLLLDSKLKDFQVKYDAMLRTVEKEQKERILLDEDCRAQILIQVEKNHHLEEQNKQLYEEINLLRDRLTERLETHVERRDFDKLIEEFDQLRTINNQYQLENDKIKLDYNTLLKVREEQDQRLNAMKKNIEELESKNHQLNEMINKEIDQQAEEYKQKTMKNLLHSAKKTSENLSRILGGNMEMEPVEERDYLRTGNLNYEQKLWDNSRTIDNFRVFEKSQEFNTRQELSRPKSPDKKSRYFNVASEKIAEQKKKISNSAQKLMQILDLGQDVPKENAFDKPNPQYQINGNPLQEIYGGDRERASFSRENTASKNSEIRPSYKRNLSEVKDKLTELNKNKETLELKMKDFEKKIRNLK